MGRISRGLAPWVAWVALVAVLVGAASCGVSTGGSAGAGGGAAVGSSAASTPIPAATQGPATVVILPTTTEPGGSIAGVLAVTVDRREYSPGDTIVVTVTNGMNRDVFAANHQTGCTIVRLERFDAGAWIAAGGCAEGIMAILVPVRGATVSTFQLAPGSGMVKPTVWAPGTYRASLRYTTSDHAMGAPAEGAFSTAYSATFMVG